MDLELPVAWVICKITEAASTPRALHSGLTRKFPGVAIIISSKEGIGHKEAGQPPERGLMSED